MLGIAISVPGQNKSQHGLLSVKNGDTALHLKLVKTQGSNKYHEVRYAITDKVGNLWFCTTGEGVYRYNGKTFTQFTGKDGLGSNAVWVALQDKAGNIWFGTDAGLCRYDGKKFTGIPINSSSGYISVFPTGNTDGKNAVWAMLEDKGGMLWFCTKQGVFCYNGKTFNRFLENDGVINKDGVRLKEVGYIMQDKDGNIWFVSGVAGGDGICCYNGNSITSFKPGGDTWIRYIVEDKKGVIWLGTRSHGNWQYNGKDFVRYTGKSGIGAPLVVDKKGNIWFSGEEHDDGYSGNGGIWRYDGNSFTNFTAKDGMGNYGVWCMLEDHFGNMWIGTRNTGLYRYDGKSFTCFSN